MRLFGVVLFLVMTVIVTIIGVLVASKEEVTIKIVEKIPEPVVVEPLDCDTGLVYNKENHVCVKECPEYANYDFTLEDCTFPYNNEYPELSSTNACNGETINGITISEYYKTLEYFDPRTCLKNVHIQSLAFGYPVIKGYRYIYADEMERDDWK